ncbi:MAG: DUF2069 domain-containing protein [Gammaproteobacteria bacterium]
MNDVTWRPGFRVLAGLSHACLIVATVAWSLSLRMPGPLPAIMIALLLIPLLLTIRGLIADQRYTYQWLSLVLVIFIGASTTEVIASLRAEAAAIVVMIASVAELLSVLILIRFAQPRRLE